MQPHHETTLLVHSGAAWDTLDVNGRRRMVRATELTVADDFIFFKQILLYGSRCLRASEYAQKPLEGSLLPLAGGGQEEGGGSNAITSILIETLTPLACFRRYAAQAPEATAFFASTRPGQLARRHRPRTAAALCWLLRREPRSLYFLAPLIESIGLVYSRQLLQDRRNPRDPWRALHTLHQRDEADHLSACCRLLAACLAPLSSPKRLSLWLCGGAACSLLLLVTRGNSIGAWRLVWPRTPSLETRLLRWVHTSLGRGGRGQIHAKALRQCLSRIRQLLHHRPAEQALQPPIPRTS